MSGKQPGHAGPSSPGYFSICSFVAISIHMGLLEGGQRLDCAGLAGLDRRVETQPSLPGDWANPPASQYMGKYGLGRLLSPAILLLSAVNRSVTGQAESCS